MDRLFDDLNRVELLPNPLAEGTREMMVEAETSCGLTYLEIETFWYTVCSVIWRECMIMWTIPFLLNCSTER